MLACRAWTSLMALGSHVLQQLQCQPADCMRAARLGTVVAAAADGLLLANVSPHSCEVVKEGSCLLLVKRTPPSDGCELFWT